MFEEFVGIWYYIRAFFFTFTETERIVKEILTIELLLGEHDCAKFSKIV